MRFISRFDQILERFSRIGIVVSLVCILALAVLGIFLRWGGVSPMWIDPLVRHLVFLSAFFGGSLATSAHQHIKVDLLTKLVEKSSWTVLHWLHRNLISFFCVLTVGALVKSGWEFFLVEKEFGSHVFLGLHSSWLVSIIPFGMGLIGLRFFNQLMLGVFSGVKRESHHL